MGLIIKEHTVTGTRRNDTVRVLYDTGASDSLVRRDIAQPLGDFAVSPVSMEFMMANGQGTFTVDQVITLAIDVEGTPLVYTFYVADDLAEELVIGADMMQRFKITLDMEGEAVSIDPRALYLRA